MVKVFIFVWLFYSAYFLPLLLKSGGEKIWLFVQMYQNVEYKSRADGLPFPQRYWAILAVGFGVTVSVLDGAIANVALPTIAGDLHTSAASSIWVVNAYQLAITVSLLSLSSVGEIWGYRNVYITGLLLFSVTSLACALSDSLAALAVSRMLQGFGAAAITSVNTALIRIIYPRVDLAKGLAINALVVSVSAAAGPTVAAAILSVANWPWLFVVNIPIGLASLCLSYKFLPANTLVVKGRKFDYESALLNALTFGLLIAVIEGFTHDVPLGWIIGGFIVLSVCGFFYVRRDCKKEFPLLPIDMLRIPIFRLSILTSIFSFMAQMLALVSLPFFLQNTLDKSEVGTGLLLTPWPLTTMVFAIVAGVLTGRKIQAGYLGAVGLLLLAAGLALLALLPEHPSDGEIVWRMALCGCGFGLFQTPNNSIIIGSAPESRSGGASGMLGTARLLGQTTGAALVALMFNLFPDHGTTSSLCLGCCLAIVGSFVSLTRIKVKAEV